MSSELLLIENIKKDIDVDNSLKGLVAIHSGVIQATIYRYNLPQSGVFKDDLIGEVPEYLYEAAKSYDPNKGCKFSTWASYLTHWNLSKLSKKINKELSNPPFEPEEEAEPWKQEKIEEILAYLRETVDAKTYRVFRMRYLEPTNGKLKSWKEIGDKMGYSLETVRGWHNEALKQLKEHFVHERV